MTITQLIQNSPAKANELFARLAATGNGAVKTRESLFEELKAELELNARLEEEHLFPALRKHKETKDLVRAAVDGNKQTRALVGQLDGMSKEGEEFLAKLGDLRKAFQQHVRDEKKELLPAVKTALTSEEAQAITEKVEADKAALEEGKQQEAEKRRAAARREREKVQAEEAAAEAAKRQQAEERRAAAREEREKAERRQAQAEARQQRARDEEKRQHAELRAEQRRVREEEKRLQEEAEAGQRRARETGEALARTGESLLESTQSIAAAGAGRAQAATEAMVERSQALTGVVNEAFGQTGAMVAGALQSYSERAQPAMENLQALASLPSVAVGAAAEAGKAWFELVSRTAESRTRRSRELLNCVRPLDAVEVQSRYAGETMQAWLEANAKMLDISVEAYWGMAKPLASAADVSGDLRKRT